LPYQIEMSRGLTEAHLLTSFDNTAGVKVEPW